MVGWVVIHWPESTTRPGFVFFAILKLLMKNPKADLEIELFLPFPRSALLSYGVKKNILEFCYKAIKMCLSLLLLLTGILEGITSLIKT